MQADIMPTRSIVECTNFCTSVKNDAMYCNIWQTNVLIYDKITLNCTGNVNVKSQIIQSYRGQMRHCITLNEYIKN